ncbi:Membrane transport protein like protein [Aduncisulcus paluster]|uniref:Membrane transport protein like protein n=1 Tax=Aduncisulcus paluster TaxID=2918883 RepID=A0ABQ5KH08_9EUKA|nr:Membrane transport protein like protein [Aduncisulcus paluster]
MSVSWANYILIGQPIIISIYGEAYELIPVYQSVIALLIQLPIYVTFFELIKTRRERTQISIEITGESPVGDNEIIPSNNPKTIEMKITPEPHNSQSLDLDERSQTRPVSLTVCQGIIKNPMLFAMIFGIIWAFLPWDFPEMVSNFLDFLSGVVTPIGLFSFGLFVGCLKDIFDMNDSAVHKGQIWAWSILFAFLRSLVCPFIILFVMRVLGFGKIETHCAMISAGSPVAVQAFNYASEYNVFPERYPYSLLIEVIILTPCQFIFTACVNSIWGE